MKMLKVVIYNFNRVIIEGYNRLFDIDDSMIKIDNFIIKGDKLKISSLDCYCIEITGNITSIGVLND